MYCNDRGKSKDWTILVGFFVFLLICFVHLDKGLVFYVHLVNRLFVYHGYPKTIFYVGTFCGSILGITVIYASKNVWIRYASYLVTFCSLSIWLSYKNINSNGFGYCEAQVALANFGFAGEVFSSFSGQIAWALITSVVFVAAIELCNRFFLPKVSARWAFFSVVMLLPVYVINARTSGDISNFPAVYEVPAITYVAYADTLPYGPRREPIILPKHEPLSKHIILVVDESIRGDMLSLNGYEVATTPYLESISDRIANFGVASSATNCSSTTNIVLENAIRIDQLPDKDYLTLRQPTLFEYAKEVGYRTYLVDGPNSKGKPRRYITDHESVFIDEYICIAQGFSGAAYEIDYRIADVLAAITSCEELTFTYVIKYGCHFMYDHDYPQSAKNFAPTISDKKEHSLDVILNSYYNAVSWSVDGFFESLVPQIDGRDLIILYTSDHGQSIEKYRTLPATHCVGTGAPCSQAMVPLFILSVNGSACIDEIFPLKMVEHNFNNASHYNIVPTLLLFMGYDKNDINLNYGSTLADELDGYREFITGGVYGKGFFEKRRFVDTISDRGL